MTEGLVKMTVIIEDGDEVVTTVIHRVERPEFRVNYRDVAIRLGDDGGMPRPISKADFQFNGVAFFHPEDGTYFTYKREKKDA